MTTLPPCQSIFLHGLSSLQCRAAPGMATPWVDAKCIFLIWRTKLNILEYLFRAFILGIRSTPPEPQHQV